MRYASSTSRASKNKVIAPRLTSDFMFTLDRRAQYCCASSLLVKKFATSMPRLLRAAEATVTRIPSDAVSTPAHRKPSELTVHPWPPSPPSCRLWKAAIAATAPTAVVDDASVSDLNLPRA